MSFHSIRPTLFKPKNYKSINQLGNCKYELLIHEIPDGFITDDDRTTIEETILWNIYKIVGRMDDVQFVRLYDPIPSYETFIEITSHINQVLNITASYSLYDCVNNCMII